MPELRSQFRKGLLIPMLREPVAELPEKELTPEQRKRDRRPLERLESADQTDAISRGDHLER
jgi:hypothetical protein